MIGKNESISSDEGAWFPFADAFEEDTGTFPYGTLSRVASHVTSMNSTIDAAIMLSKCSKNDILLDFGCGEGRVTSYAAVSVGCNVIGIDCSETELVKAQNKAKELGIMHLSRYINCDILDFQQHLPNETDYRKLIIYMYLIPTQVNSKKVKEVLKEAMTKGARVVTVRFHPNNAEDDDIWSPKSIDTICSAHLYHL